VRCRAGEGGLGLPPLPWSGPGADEEAALEVRPQGPEGRHTEEVLLGTGKKGGRGTPPGTTRPRAGDVAVM